MNGAELRQDDKATAQWYGKDVSFTDILRGKVQTPNAQAKAFVNAVESAKAKESASAQ